MCQDMYRNFSLLFKSVETEAKVASSLEEQIQFFNGLINKTKLGASQHSHTLIMASLIWAIVRVRFKGDFNLTKDRTDVMLISRLMAMQFLDALTCKLTLLLTQACDNCFDLKLTGALQATVLQLFISILFDFLSNSRLS